MGVGLFEVGIVLVEAVLLYLMQGKELPFKEALILSLLLNVDSFVVGLFCLFESHLTPLGGRFRPPPHGGRWRASSAPWPPT